MRVRRFVGLWLLAVTPALADEPQASGVTLMQPSPQPPVSQPGPVRARVADGARTAAAPGGELSGLRAVTLREGEAVVSLAGVTRSVRPGDALGSTTVKSVGSDRIVLVRNPPSGAGAPTFVVIRFGPGGQASARTYAPVTEAPTAHGGR